MRAYSGGRRRWDGSVKKDALIAAWEKIKEGGGSGRDGISPSRFAATLGPEIRLINRRMRAMTYEFQPYVEMLKSKGAGKVPRTISMPSVRDRIALRVMASFLKGVYPAASARLPQDVVAQVVGELSSGRSEYFAKLDVKEFYPSISHHYLRARLTQVLRNTELVGLFMRAVSTPSVARSAPRPVAPGDRGVPQGLAISNGLAELVMGSVDAHLAAIPTIRGFRFVDDILILGEEPSGISDAVREIRRLSALVGLEVHEDANPEKSKSGPIDDGFDFLGYSFEWPRVTVRKGSISKLESRIARAFTAYKYALARTPQNEAWSQRCKERLQWHLDLIISGFVLDGRRIGWLAYFSQIRNMKLLHRLDSLVLQKAGRFGVAEMNFKSFVQTYRIVSSRRHDESGYVPNFDTLSVEEMRRVLDRVFGVRDVIRLTDEDVRGRFKRRLKRLSKELESDVPSYH